MRIHFCIASVLLIFIYSQALLAERPRLRKYAKDQSIPNINAVLKEASRIAIRQDKHQGYWCDRTLLDIADVQIKAGDFDGALHTITKSNYQYGREAALNDLAKAMARADRRKQALKVSQHLRTEDSWKEDYFADSVTMAYLEYQISKGHLKAAHKSIEKLKDVEYRNTSLLKLAMAQEKVGNKPAARSLFQLALAAAPQMRDEYSRASAMWEIADAYIALKDFKAASSTIQQLSKQTKSFKNGWAKVTAFREAAVRAAKTGDRTIAMRLYRQAIDSRKAIKHPEPLPELNKIGALNMIAKSQASVGFFDEALKTAHMIKHTEDDSSPDGDREEALYTIAVAQAKSGDIAAAVATARSIKYYVQYKTDIMVEVANLQLRLGKLKDSIVTADQIANPSKKATAYLKVAIAYANAGNKKTARTIAGRIRLTLEDFLGLINTVQFDFSKPPTWGIVCQASFTNSSRNSAIRRASEVAAASMTLSLALNQRYPESYAIMFKDFASEEIVRALTRAHAATGNANEALAWARRIGSDEKIKSSGDWESTSSVENRIHALVGVAEGILDRQSRGGG